MLQSLSRAFVIVVLASLGSHALAQGTFIETISVPPGSQDSFCTVNTDNTPLVTVPPYPFNTGLGIGYIVNPNLPAGVTDFVLHDHVYLAPNIPDPARAQVRYEFNTAVVVTGVLIMQHANGISRVEGFAGNSSSSLTSAGSVFGTLGDVTGAQVFVDFMLDTFTFTNPVAGKIFDVVIRKTSLGNGWANFRIVPLGPNGLPLPVAQFGLDGCAAGTVGSSASLVLSPLKVNGQTGGAARRVDLPVGQAINISMAQPSTNSFPSNFIIVGMTAVPDSSDAYALPGASGVLCINTLYTNPGFAGLFVLANSFGPDAFAVFPATPTPWSAPTVPGLPFPFQFTLQGVMEETPGVIRTSNAVLTNIF